MDENPSGSAHELPAAHLVPRARVPAPRGIDYPALGVVLAVTALYSLPASLGLLAQIIVLDLGGPSKMSATVALMSCVGLTQLLAGIAIAWRWRRRRLWFAAWVVTCLAVVISTLFTWPEELGSRHAGVLFMEVLGPPVVAIAGTRWIKSSSGGGLGALLIIGGVSMWLAQPVYAIEHARSLVGDSSVGGWLGFLQRFGVTFAIATTTLVAGLRMARGLPARRALAIAVIVALGGLALADVLSIVGLLVYNDGYPALKYVVPSMATSLAVSICKWLLIWSYAKREPEPMPSVGAALPWLALWFVPALLSRCLLFNELGELGELTRILVVAGCAVCAITLVIAVRTARVVWWLVAASAAAILFAIGLYVAHTVDLGPGVRARDVLTPISVLLATTATAAWLARRVSSS